jgi:hypothetical protein
MTMVYRLFTRVETTRAYGAEFKDGRWSQVRPVVDPTEGSRFNESLQNAAKLGVRIETAHVPTRMHWQAPGRVPIPDFEGSYFLNVSQRARDVVERVEPDTHQFIPLRYETRDGKLVEDRFMFVVANRVDSVDREETTMILWRSNVWRSAKIVALRHPNDVPSDVDLEAPARLVFDLNRIGNRHVWRDPFVLDGPYVSSVMASAMMDAGLTGVGLAEVETAVLR